MENPDNGNRSLMALTGGSGYIGGRSIPLREKQGVKVRCLARSLEKMRSRAMSYRDLACRSTPA